MKLLIKFIATFIATWIAFSVIETNPISWILIIAILGTILNYVIGDLLILRSLGNVVASIADGILASLLVYICDIFSDLFYTTFTSIVVYFIIIALFEFFFHKYIVRE